MNSEEKFRKILKRAEQNGFKIDKGVFLDHEDAPPLMGLLLNNEFAKAIFGDYVARWCREHIRDMCKEFELDHLHVGYKFHMKQAIMADDMIDYWYDHLDERVTKKWDINKKEVVEPEKQNPAFWDDTLETVIEDDNK